MFSQPPDLIAHIRQRPQIYVGGTGQNALHELLYEALVFSLKEAISKNCTTLNVTLGFDQQVTIEDDSLGIDPKPIDASGITFLELKLTRRSTERHHGMETHPLYGIGLPVVNALSQAFTIEVRRDGHLWRQEYCNGEKHTPVMCVRLLTSSEKHGLTLHFKPDFEILEQNNFDYAAIAMRLRIIAFLMPDLTITLKDERIGLRDQFNYREGLKDFARFFNRGQILLHDPIYGIEEIETMAPGQWSYTVRVEVACQFIASGGGMQRVFVNTQRANNPVVERAARAGILWALNRFARKHLLLKSDAPDLNVTEITYGLTTVISIYHLYSSTGNQRLAQMLQQNTWDAALRATINAFLLVERQRPQELRRIVDSILNRRRF
ncbi:MAG: ATP-binding protein [Anaerolineae bacterium]